MNLSHAALFSISNYNRSVAIHSSHHSAAIQPTAVSFNKRSKLSGDFDVSFQDSTKDVNVRRSRWNVSYERLKSPNWFLLEQSFKVVENTDPDVVTRRIEDVNRELSVFAKYDNNKVINIFFTQLYHLKIVLN